MKCPSDASKARICRGLSHPSRTVIFVSRFRNLRYRALGVADLGSRDAIGCRGITSPPSRPASRSLAPVPVRESVRPALAAAAVGPHAHGPRTTRADRHDLDLEDAARKPLYRDASDSVAADLLDAATIDVHGYSHDPRAAR